MVLELAGGNDGFSMAPPVEADHLRSMRPTSAHGPADQLNGDGDVVLHPGFGRLRHRPLLLVDGVGSPAPDLSHFEMLRRLWAGDPDGTQTTHTGFLGRLCDQLDTGAPVTGLTTGAASSPALIAERAGTIGLPELWWLEWLSDDDWWAETYRDALAQMTSRDAGDTEALALARRGIAGGLGLGGPGHPADRRVGVSGDVARYEPVTRLPGHRRRRRRARHPGVGRRRFRHPRESPGARITWSATTS